MRSHTCEFELHDVLRLTFGPLLMVAVLAALLHLGARAGLLPSPRPTLDTDRTILIHQVDASRQGDPARVLLLGDSSCLMDVSASQLAEQLGEPVLNLATLSYLDAGANGLLLREFAAANPGQLRAVVMLMHPEALRRIMSEHHQLAALTNYLAGTDHQTMNSLAGWLALETLRGRVLARAVPTPLPGTFGRTYGFSPNLEDFMTAQCGSLPEPDSAPLTGSAEYRLSPSLRPAALEFKQAVPPGVKLLVGLTPVPVKLAGPDFAESHRTILRQWSEWLGADATLDDLPATLPDDRFARSTHLKPAAMAGYTTALARSVRKHLN